VVREVFHGELARLGAELASMCGGVCSSMDRAVRALLEVDLVLAEQVISDDTEIDEAARRIEEHACTLLALQAPVASELRTVVCAIRTGERLGRMGDLARHVAEIVRLRHPSPAVPAELADRFAEMGQLAVEAVLETEHAILAPRPCWQARRQADDRLDRLQREVLDQVGRAEPRCSVQTGVDVALLARYFERFGDQAVSITRLLDYVLTGRDPAALSR
jgi:phosphate transport system protein